MKPTDFASLEIRDWQQALAEQRQAEHEQDEARKRSEALTFYFLRRRVQALRQRAALLLAKVVEKKLSLRRGPRHSDGRANRGRH